MHILALTLPRPWRGIRAVVFGMVICLLVNNITVKPPIHTRFALKMASNPYITRLHFWMKVRGQVFLKIL